MIDEGLYDVDVLRQILLVLHIVGIAALLGGFLTQMSALRTGDVRIVPAMTHGALTMLVTGLALVGVVQSGLDRDVDTAKIGTKLGILLVVLLLVWGNRAADRVSARVLGAIGLLTVANIAIAVMWT
ncbi:hypothetical protein EHYA_03130 [Embleya hyalina]|uniref:Integral membrane protein n=1 Tax=Embleya hyalina TaxID=516124 RepID=A0A401YLI2_9ACTN|nr:hypothetical protein EHYA_03130 [Embleya hyalina]